VRSMFTAMFNPKTSSIVRMSSGVSRYPVANMGRHLSALPAEPASVTAAKTAMCSLGKEFQDLIDSNQPVKNSQLGDLERAFNDHMDSLIRQGEHPLDVMEYLKRDCGIRTNILHEMRPRLYWNNVTGLTAYGGETPPPYVPPQPPPVSTPSTTSKPIPPPPVERKPVETPSVTSGMTPWAPVDLRRSYDEPYSDYLKKWSEVNQPPTPTPTPPQQPVRPPVETGAAGCWYVPGKGYSWGARPSGGESTGLSQSDCEAIKARDLEIRTGQTQLTQQAQCDTSRGQFIDPRTGQCRGSVSSAPGVPFGFDGGGLTTGMQASGVTAASSFMGGRRVALRGVHSNGNLEWWSYQQAFLPPLFFARRRVNYATLGAGKPVPEGMCCQATDDGGAICSNGQGFPPTCPNKPEPNTPGVAQRINQEGYLVPKPPPAPVNGTCAVATTPEKPSEGSGIAPLVGIAAAGALIYAVVEGLL